MTGSENDKTGVIPQRNLIHTPKARSVRASVFQRDRHNGREFNACYIQNRIRICSSLARGKTETLAKPDRKGPCSARVLVLGLGRASNDCVGESRKAEWIIFGNYVEKRAGRIDQRKRDRNWPAII